MNFDYVSNSYTPRQNPEGIVYPDNCEAKKIRGYYSDIGVLIQSDGSIDVDVLLFENCFHNMQHYLFEQFGVKTFEQMLADERLYKDAFSGSVSYASFECNIPKEFQQEALFRLIESPDSFAQWVDEHNGYNGNADWRQ